MDTVTNDLAPSVKETLVIAEHTEILKTDDPATTLVETWDTVMNTGESEADFLVELDAIQLRVAVERGTFAYEQFTNERLAELIPLLELAGETAFVGVDGRPTVYLPVPSAVRPWLDTLCHEDQIVFPSGGVGYEKIAGREFLCLWWD